MSESPNLADHVHLVRVFAKRGIVRPRHPRRIAAAVRAVKAWGPTPAGGYGFNNALYPQREAIIDELGRLTYRQIHHRTNAIANALQASGVNAGDTVAVMCRNHRGWVESTVALSKLGVHALYLNTSFAKPQVHDVCARERPTAIIYDQEFSDRVNGAIGSDRRFIAWVDDWASISPAGGSGEMSRESPDRNPDAPTLESLTHGDASDREPPAQKGRFLILTSGTTGTPKGADREQPRSLHPAAALMDKIPLRARRRTLIASPLFHSWAFAHFTIGMSISSTLILRRFFDPQETLALIDRHKVSHLIVVPVMLQRILELPQETIDRYDIASLKVIAASGSALPGETSIHVMDKLGDTLYNLYGSTEVAWATIATPKDLRAAPGTAGSPPRGTTIRLVDESGEEVPRGQTGRIFVVNELQMRGYTGGGNKEVLGAFMATGDVGRIDEAGRLFVQGRDDEMIVSGGENVFPREVEDLLTEHDAIEEVALIGVEDSGFGQRLVAFVVLHPGADVTAEQLRGYVRDNLADFKVPREFVFIDELPRNETGKIIKRELEGAHAV